MRLDYAFRDGLRSTLHNARWILSFYVASLLLGLLQNWPLLAVGDAVLRNPLTERLEEGELDAVVDLFLGQPEAFAYVGLWTLIALALVPLYGLLYNFWSGGIASIAAGRRPFWPGGRHTFWSFTALGLMVSLLIALAVAIGVLLRGLLGWGSVMLVLVLVGLANTLSEYARAAAVVQDRRNPFVLLEHAGRFCVRHLPGTLALSAAGFTLHVTLFAAYSWVAGLLDEGMIIVVLQQITALVFIWIKALRLTWATTYMRGMRHAVPAVGSLDD
jgi:hypothetical protein